MSDPNTENSSVPPVERVRHEVDRWLDVVRSTGEKAMETLGLSANRVSSPPVDIVDLPEMVIVLVDLPGVSAETVELSLAGNLLSLTANRQRPEFASEARLYLRERVVGRIQRSIPLPAAISDDPIRAEVRDGLLTVTLRKANPATGRTIPVSRGGNSGI